MSINRIVSLALIVCIFLGSAPTAGAAIPPPPEPYAFSEPLPPIQFFAAEQIYQQDWRRGTYYLFTMLNGTSASFYVEVKPSEACLQGACKPSDFPLNVEVYFGVRHLDDLVITNWGGKYRQLSGEVGSPFRAGPDKDPEEISIAVSPNPVILNANDKVRVKVTITAKPTASYGLYVIGIGGRSGYFGGISWPYAYLKIVQFHVKPDSKYKQMIRAEQYQDIRKSERFGEAGWFELERNGTLGMSYDGRAIQYGWWEIKEDNITFILPDTTLTGKKGYCFPTELYCDIVLYDGSVWRWTIPLEQMPIPLLERCKDPERFGMNRTECERLIDRERRAALPEQNERVRKVEEKGEARSEQIGPTMGYGILVLIVASSLVLGLLMRKKLRQKDKRDYRPKG